MYNLILKDRLNLEIVFEVGSLLEGLDLLENLKDNLHTLHTEKIILKPKEEENEIYS